MCAPGQGGCLPVSGAFAQLSLAIQRMQAMQKRQKKETGEDLTVMEPLPRIQL